MTLRTDVTPFPARLSSTLRQLWAGLGLRAPAPRSHRHGAGAEQLLRLFQDSDSGLLTCRPDGKIVLCSAVAARLFNAEAEAVTGTPIAQWLVPLGEQGADFAAGQWETTARRVDGSSFPVELTVSTAQVDGAEQRILILRDISERKLVQERLAYLASFDSLTGLPNRVMFRDRLDGAMARARRTAVPMALMFLDLDNFKVINDSLGHDVGDRLLQHLAETLKRCLRAVDSLGAPSPTTCSRSRDWAATSSR